MCTIYIVVIPHLALRNYVALSDLTRCEIVCETYLEGRGSIWVDLLSRKNSVIRKSAAPLLHLRRAVSTHLLPRQIPHGVISARQLSLGFLSVPLSLSVCLSPFSSLHISARAPACVHGDVCRRHVDFYLRLPLLSRCAEILSWITINLSQ